MILCLFQISDLKMIIYFKNKKKLVRYIDVNLYVYTMIYDLKFNLDIQMCFTRNRIHKRNRSG